MTTYKFGDIVLIGFPHTDSSNVTTRRIGTIANLPGPRRTLTADGGLMTMKN